MNVLKILREEDISMGFRSPDDAKIVAMPLCSVCKNIAGKERCKAFGERPMIYRNCESYDCPHVELDENDFTFPQFAELYPDIVKRLTEKNS